MALRKVIDVTRVDGISLLLIAGDLFDNNRVQDFWVEKAVQEFRRTEAQILIVPGNHDCVAPDSVYRRARMEEAVPGLKIIYRSEGETVRFPSLALAVWGKAIPDYEGDCRPLSGVPPRGHEKWHIAVGHGMVVRTLYQERFSYPISPQEIQESAQDYIALGHQDVFEVVSEDPVLSCYAGSPSRTGRIAVLGLDEVSGIRVSSWLLP